MDNSELDNKLEVELPEDIKTLNRLRDLSLHVPTNAIDVGHTNIFINVYTVDSHDNIIQLNITLPKAKFYNRDLCSSIDSKIKCNKDKVPLINLIKLRVLRVIFEACKMAQSGELDSTIEQCTGKPKILHVRIVYDSGIIFYSPN